jgi:hypothetical protein
MQETVRSYFHDAIDGGNAELVRELFTEDCLIHRPEFEIRGIEPFVRFIGFAPRVYSSFRTTLLDLFAGEDRVAARLRHDAVSSQPWRSRLGTHDVAGRSVTWDAMAIFRFEGDVVAEEWVNRDELGMLLSYGVLEPNE